MTVGVDDVLLYVERRLPNGRVCTHASRLIGQNCLWETKCLFELIADRDVYMSLSRWDAQCGILEFDYKDPLLT